MFRATSTALMLRATSVLREQETWRDQGVSYLQYLNVCTETVHKCVKPAVAGKYNKFTVMNHRATKVDETGATIEIETIPNESANYGKKAEKTSA